MKKLLTAILAAMVLTGCAGAQPGESTGNDTIKTETEAPKPADLCGDWIQKDHDPEGTWMTAEISADVIEVYWNMDGGETKALYWAGTYNAPTESGDYIWSSVNDKDKTDMALLASGADTKDFSYESGEILFELTAMGVTSTIHLIQSES